MSENHPSRPPDSGGSESDASLGERLLAWLRGLNRGRNGGENLRESLEELIEQHADDETPLNQEERTMLVNLLNFGDLRVDDVMVPRADVVAVEQTTPLAKVVGIIREVGHSRLPVFRGNMDDITGMVHVRDLLKYWGSNQPFTLTHLVRPLLFVPPSMRVRDLLLQMRATRVHMAVVVDEYGGTDGLVTIEDLVEEIVGEIHDEHDVDERPMLVDKPGGVVEADARARVEDLEARVGFSLLAEDGDEDVDTLGGLVFSLAGRVPARGELIIHPAGLQFEILEADPRRVKRLRIERVPAATE
ncbi:MAG: HlyC/CorC family transporter [Proteobacteria bacterium]|nr:HlyC/CorC family transporter [Pseudomonadota bacterium]